MEINFKILGIAGSLRRQSYNRAVLAAATRLAPTGATVETFDLAGIPPFNEDDEFNPPTAVVDFKRGSGRPTRSYSLRRSITIPYLGS